MFTHDRCPSYRPWCTILKVGPHSLAFVRLWTVDRADWEPNNEYQHYDNIDHSSHQVESANESRRLHRENALDSKYAEENQVYMPSLRNVRRIRDTPSGDKHGG